MRALLLLFSAGMLVLGLTVGCQNKSMTLEYVIPDGFSGIIKLRAGSADGIALTPTNGHLTLAFPASGTLVVRGRLPTLEWHKAVARFADGTPIQIPGPASAVPDDVIALRGLGIKSNNTESWYLVGKAEQMQDAMNKFYGFQVPKR